MFCRNCGYLLADHITTCPHCSMPVRLDKNSSSDNPAPSAISWGNDTPMPPPLRQEGEGSPANSPQENFSSFVAPTVQASLPFSGEAQAPGAPQVLPTVYASPPPPAFAQRSQSSPDLSIPPPTPTPGSISSNPMPGQSSPGFYAPPPPPSTPGQMSLPGTASSVPSAYGSPAPAKGGGQTTIIAVGLVLLLVGICTAVLFSSGTILTRSQAQGTVSAITDGATSTAESLNATGTAVIVQTTADARSTQYALSLTPTPYPAYTESNPPSHSTFSGNAQQNLPITQLASQINSKYQPTELQSVFSPGQTIYLTYQWNNRGVSGYVYTIWYFNGQEVSRGHSSLISTRYSYYTGYISLSFDGPGQGAVEVYWTTNTGGSGRQLAWVRPFTVSGN